MIKDKLTNIMDFISETNMTEEYFYSNRGKYPVYSGQTLNDGIIAYINTFKEKEECVSFTSYGSAGKLSYRNGKYTIGRNALGMKPKEEYRDKIILKWFAYKFQNIFYRKRIGDKDGQKSLNQILLNNLTIEIPTIDEQEKQLTAYEKLNDLKCSLRILQLELNEINDYKFTNLPKITDDKIGNVFDIIGGNSGLTEEFIYHNQPTNEDERVPIYSSSTSKTTTMGFISKYAKINNSQIKTFKGNCILIARNGYAGNMTYITKEEFTTNDHAYVMSLKEAWKGRMNLRWFAFQYQELFFNLVTSKSDNATFNKEYAERQDIEIISKDLQDQIANKLILIDNLKFELMILEKEIQELLEHEIT